MLAEPFESADSPEYNPSRITWQSEWRLIRRCFASPEGVAGTLGILMAIGMWLTYGRRPGLEVKHELTYLGAHVAALVLLPMLLARLALRIPLREQNLTLGRPLIWGPYILVFGALVAPAVWLAAGGMATVHAWLGRGVASDPSAAFLSFYPYWPGARLSAENFLLHQLVMFVVIFANEYFFRGFMLSAAARRMPPSAAIVFQMIPYAMGHAGKVPQEFVSSVFAGLALGVMAWRGKSVWPCVFLHWPCGVALDVAAAPEVAAEAGQLLLGWIGLGG